MLPKISQVGESDLFWKMMLNRIYTTNLKMNIPSRKYTHQLVNLPVTTDLGTNQVMDRVLFSRENSLYKKKNLL